MAKLNIKFFEPKTMSHCPHVPCFKVHVELVGDSVLSTVVMICFAPLDSDTPEWCYMYSMDPKFDELDCKWKYKPTEEILKYAERVIASSEAFKTWGQEEEVSPGSDRDSTSGREDGEELERGAPSQRCPSAHAESRLARKLDVGSIVYVSRTLKNGDIVLAKPCRLCQNVMRHRGVSTVYYSINNVEYGCIEL